MKSARRERLVAVVTGASSGIGAATAQCLAEAGYRVALVARRKPLLDAVAHRIDAAGGEALVVPTDLSNDDATEGVVGSTMGAFGRIDLVVNNAGFSPAAALEQMSRSQMRGTFEVNLFAALQLVSECTPVMREQGGGRIINISSLASCVPAPLAVTYSATKGGMEAATACLRLELARWNIQLSVIIPGFVDTPAFETAKRSASGLRADPTNPYRQLMFDLEAFSDRQLERATSPREVGELVVRVARSRRPRPRYYIPLSSRWVASGLQVLPRSWSDGLLKRLYHL